MSGTPEKLPISTILPTLCNDVVESVILPRLPAKALLRFKCVSRRWNHYISRPNPKFISLQSLHAESCLVEDRYFKYELKRRCVSRDPKSVGIPDIAKQIKPILYVWGVDRIVASCNGLLCCISDKSSNNKIVIGNPSMNNWKLITLNHPTSHIEGVDVSGYVRRICISKFVFGLAVDVESSVQYTLLSLTRQANGNYEMGVFSSTTEQWNVIRDKDLLPFGTYFPNDQVAVYVEGCMYWKVIKDIIFDSGTNWGMMHFKTDCGVFWYKIGKNLHGYQPLPENYDYPLNGRIGEYGGKISYASIKVGGIHIWSLDHQGWSMKFSINLDIFAKPCKEMIICFETRDILSFCVEGTIYSLDTLTGNLTKLTEPVPLGNKIYWVSCKSTLVTLPLERQQNEAEINIRQDEEYIGSSTKRRKVCDGKKN